MEGFKSAETFCTKKLFNITTKSNNYLVSSHAMVLTNGARTSPHRRVVLHPSHQRQPIGKNSMNGKSEADPNNDVKPKNDLEEENAVKVKLPSCLSYEGKRHLKLAHNNSDV
ncbi:hypothetical protein pdam_00013509 [Pocillopora damicornis]|uniref:Uncharacterized protein n=1 Tax=Pocillopora damicornis TaxID=46731 RepID=A0A3M6TJ29_POCDA|nr:hypothetical protein pdam_00013509 [Pocillopora damicornis]